MTKWRDFIEGALDPAFYEGLTYLVKLTHVVFATCFAFLEIGVKYF